MLETPRPNPAGSLHAACGHGYARPRPVARREHEGTPRLAMGAARSMRALVGHEVGHLVAEDLGERGGPGPKSIVQANRSVTDVRPTE